MKTRTEIAYPKPVHSYADMLRECDCDKRPRGVVAGHSPWIAKELEGKSRSERRPRAISRNDGDFGNSRRVHQARYITSTARNIDSPSLASAPKALEKC